MLDLSALTDISQGYVRVLVLGSELLIICSISRDARAMYQNRAVWQDQGYKATIVYEYLPDRWAVYCSDLFDFGG